MFKGLELEKTNNCCFASCLGRRGLFEFGAYAFRGAYSNSFGMRFSDLDDPKNGMITVFIIMAVEWVVFMLLAWYIEQVRLLCTVVSIKG